MGLTRKRLFELTAGAAAGAVTASLAPSTASAAARAAGAAGSAGVEVIRRDVCVIGGGSAGTYAAVRLRDFGRSVVLVEAKDRLGGHTETYHDTTGGTVDIGVVVFEDEPLVHRYFDRFGLALRPSGGSGSSSVPIDFRTGQRVDHTPPPPTALPGYAQLISRYGPIDTVIDLPDPVPPELVAPFADFVKANDLGSIVPRIFALGQGIGDILDLPALYSINTVGPGVIRSVLNRSFLTTEARNNSLLYERATAHLGGDALLSSRVLWVDRSPSGIRVLISTPDGPRLIQAGKLVVTFPPLLRNFVGFDLDGVERSLFGQFISGAYYTGVVRLSGLPEGVGLSNVAADTPYNLPPLPGFYAVTPTAVPGLYNVKYGSPSPLPEALVRRNIRADIERVATAGTLPVVFEGFAVFSSHTPFELRVPPTAIATGFYRRLNALQGRNRTYYSGAAINSHNSTRIWTAMESLLPSIIA